MYTRHFLSLFAVLAISFVGNKTIAQTPVIPADTLPRKYFQNFILLNGMSVFSSKNDTTLHGFQVSNPILKKSFANLYTGNLGGAVKKNMTDRNELPLKFHYGQDQFAVYDFGIEPGFVLNKKIFTTLNYSRGTKKEQYFKLEHRQKIAPNAIAGLDFAVGASQGYYARQLSGIRNFDLFGIYETKDNRYRLYGKFIYNKINVNENGGLKTDSALIGVSGADARTLEVSLTDADRVHKEKSFYLQHQVFLIQPAVETDDSTYLENRPAYGLDLTHSFLINDKALVYESASIDTVYFPEIFYDSVATFDSTHTRSYYNDLKLNFSIGNLLSLDHQLDGDFYIGASNQYFKINQHEIDTLFTDWSLYGGFQLRFLEMCSLMVNYNGSVNSTVNGMKRFEAGLKYNAFNDFLNMGFKYTNENGSPELFSQLNFSNHFKWYNHFANTNQNRIDLTFDLAWLKFNSVLTYMQDKNYIYYDLNGLPGQYNGIIKNTSWSASQRIDFRKFHLVNSILLQKSSNRQLVRFPAFSSFHSFFYETKFFKGVLLTQFGIDLRYISAFYSPYYQPATGQFIFQNETQNGNYLFADVFINFKVKSARFFFKVEHVNRGWSDKSYILLAHYPMQGRMLKFGIAWNLFD